MAFEKQTPGPFSPSYLMAQPVDAYCYDIDDQLRQYVYSISSEAIARGEAARAGISSVEEAEKRKKYIRETFLSCIGGLAEDAPLEPRVMKTIRCKGFRIENIIYQAREREYVTGNLYIPDGITTPTGAVLFVCGHFDEAKIAPEYQIACQYLVQSGLVVFAIDPVGQGERYSYCNRDGDGSLILREGSYAHDYQGTQCLMTGRGIGSYFVHDAMRGIDYLCTRSEVDPDRIGVTGNSGGGTQTAMMMMADERVKAAAPATFITSRKRYMPNGEGQCMEQIWPGFTAAGLDYADMLIAMVPKPVMVMSSVNDFFPIEGTRETVAEARRVYEIYEKSDNLILFEQDCSHQYSPEMARLSAAFFNKHLNGRELPPDYASCSAEPLELSSLRCTVSGQLLMEFPDARTIFDSNKDLMIALKAKRGETEGNVRRWLRSKVYMNRRECPIQMRKLETVEAEGLQANHMIWWSQQGVFNYGVLFCRRNDEGRKLPLTLLLTDAGTTDMNRHIGWIKNECGKGRSVFVPDLSGSGCLQFGRDPLAYTRGNDLGFGYRIGFRMAICLLWLGDSLPFLRTFDLLRSLDMLDENGLAETANVEIHAIGWHGLYGKLASMIDDRIAGCGWEEGFSYEELVSSKVYPFEKSIEYLIPGVLEHIEICE